MKKLLPIFKYGFYFCLLLVLSVIFFNSIVGLYGKRLAIKEFFIKKSSYKHQVKLSNNPLDVSTDRFLPPLTNEILKKSQLGSEHIKGIWSSPFDWPVISIHLLLLPDGKVMSYGSFSADAKNLKKSIKENKSIILSNGKELNRDAGGAQWKHLEVFHGIDFDIWSPDKGVNPDSHNTIKKPIVLDSFCSLAKILDKNEVLILGGNKYPYGGYPDAQKKTVIFNVKDQKFTTGKELKHPRWYGSVVRFKDDRFVMFGGINVNTGDDNSTAAELMAATAGAIKNHSDTPEILQKDSNGIYYWKALPLGKSEELFGHQNNDFSWSYPKSYLAPDGNIFGISYNKMWSFNPDSNKPIIKVGEIPLEKGIAAKTIVHTNPNTGKTEKLLTGTIGASVGNMATSVMINDEIYMMGGVQVGFVPSNQLIKINIDDSFNPKLEKLEPMNFPRQWGNSLILPDGNIFVSGGQAYGSKKDPHDQRFSNFTPEIYDLKSNTWLDLSSSLIPRNYHNSALLLLDGSILQTGGDTWNAEIYYPPYLFEKNWEDKVIFATRPEISELRSEYNKGEEILIKSNNTENISKISLLSNSSTTHSQASELKYFDLNFSIKDNMIVALVPDNKYTLQKGVYTLFVLNKNGVPSIGQIIMIN